MVAFLAALGPLLAKGKALAASAGGGLAKGASMLGKFGAAHPKLSKGLLAGLGGGLMREFGDEQDYNAYIQALMTRGQGQQGQNKIGSDDLPGSIYL